MLTTIDAKTLADIPPENSFIQSLEQGAVLYLPQLTFQLEANEQALLSPSILPQKAKNISYDARCQSLKAFDPNHPHHYALKTMMQRYADFSSQVLQALVPQYGPHLTMARTSYRPVEVLGRTAPSYRKDDTRLHVDAFPASPYQGQQLLRVFSNVNPYGQARVWRVGEAFEQLVQHFKQQLKIPLPITKHVLKALHITRGLRTDYDALMLQLHDVMKADQQYQQQVAQQQVELVGTWIVFTDQVSHAAMSGQYCLEQTFMLPVKARQNPASSPLKVLEQAFGRQLV